MDTFFHFDKYQCTFPGVPVEKVMRSFQFVADPSDMRPVLPGYRKALNFGDAVYVLYDATAGDYGAHAIVQGGDACQPIVDEMRVLLPDHKVTRFDVAVDFDYPGAFSDLEGIALQVAMDHDLKTKVEGDYYGCKDGRTFYVGAPTSTHRCRIYEKGCQMRSKHIQPDASLDWVRVEHQIRPSKKGDARVLASRMSPDQAAFTSPWVSEISTRIGAEVQAPVKLSTKYVKSEFVSTCHHMAKQYGPGIRKAIRNGEVTVQEMMDFFHTAMILGQIPRVGLAVEPRRSERSNARSKREKVQ